MATFLEWERRVDSVCAQLGATTDAELDVVIDLVDEEDAAALAEWRKSRLTVLAGGGLLADMPCRLPSPPKQ